MTIDIALDRKVPIVANALVHFIIDFLIFIHYKDHKPKHNIIFDNIIAIIIILLIIYHLVRNITGIQD